MLGMHFDIAVAPGTSTLADLGKNYFGIKAHRGPRTAGVIWINTSEYVNGTWVRVDATFRAYNTPEESFIDHDKFLTG